jgi:hypothetical protein
MLVMNMPATVGLIVLRQSISDLRAPGIFAVRYSSHRRRAQFYARSGCWVTQS